MRLVGAQKMDIQTWLAFVAATFTLSIIPGPSVLVVTGQAIANGWRVAIICVLGEVIGGVCLMIISLLGVGAALAATPFAFLLLKWFGVVFLIYLGLKALGAALLPTNRSQSNISEVGGFKAGFLTAILNPKSLVFYLAFFTQFVDASRPLLLQYIILVLTAAGVAGLVLSGYALAAGRLRRHISSASAQRNVAGASGVLYIAGGAYIAATR